jgi:hypothetical protein
MNPAQIHLRPANQEDVPFLLELRRDVDTTAVGCLCYRAFSEWHLGDIASCKAKLDEAIY